MAQPSAARFVTPFRLTICGVEDLHGFCTTGVTHVLSILDPGWEEPRAFGAYGEHKRLNLRFDDVIDDRPGKIAPTEEDVAAILTFGLDLIAEGANDAHLLIHCHMGISRSTAAATLILAEARPDFGATECVSEIVRMRPFAWPNLLLIEYGDRMLARQGELIAAVRNHYRQTVAAYPQQMETIIRSGRGREVEGLR